MCSGGSPSRSQVLCHRNYGNGRSARQQETSSVSHVAPSAKGTQSAEPAGSRPRSCADEGRGAHHPPLPVTWQVWLRGHEPWDAPGIRLHSKPSRRLHARPGLSTAAGGIAASGLCQGFHVEQRHRTNDEQSTTEDSGAPPSAGSDPRDALKSPRPFARPLTTLPRSSDENTTSDPSTPGSVPLPLGDGCHGDGKCFPRTQPRSPPGKHSLSVVSHLPPSASRIF